MPSPLDNNYNIKPIDSIRSLIGLEVETHDSIHAASMQLLCDEVPDIKLSDLKTSEKNIAPGNLHTYPNSIISIKGSRRFLNKKLMYCNYQKYVKHYMRRYHHGKRVWNWKQSNIEGGLYIGDTPVQIVPQEEKTFEEYIDAIVLILNNCDMLPDVICQTENFIEVVYFPADDGWKPCTYQDLNKPKFLTTVDNYLKQTSEQNKQYLGLYFNFDVGNPKHILYNTNTDEFKGVGLHDIEFRCLAHYFILPISNRTYFVPDHQWTCNELWNDMSLNDVREFIKNYWGTNESVHYKPSQKYFEWLVGKIK